MNNLIESKTLQLRSPIKIGSGEAAVSYESLELTEPTLGQLRKASMAGDDVDELACLIHLVASVPMAVVDRIKQRDAQECSDFFGQFSKNHSPTR